MSTTSAPSAPIITENAVTRRGVDLDRLDEIGPRGGVSTYWRRADRREGPDRIVSTWDSTQRAAIARCSGPTMTITHACTARLESRDRRGRRGWRCSETTSTAPVSGGTALPASKAIPDNRHRLAPPVAHHGQERPS